MERFAHAEFTFEVTDTVAGGTGGEAFTPGFDAKHGGSFTFAVQ